MQSESTSMISNSFFDLDNSFCDEGSRNISGNRIFDVTILAGVLELLCCPDCKENNLTLSELGKLGSSRKFQLSCTCLWTHEFWSSKKVDGGSFEINRRMVYGSRSCGIGYNSLRKFNAILNLPPPLTRNNYTLTSKWILESAKDVAKETMLDAAKEIASSKRQDKEDVVNCGVSCEGAWQKRGFSSLNGAYTVLSIDTGKILDIEPMSRYCKVCVQNEKMKEIDRSKYEKVKADHVCRVNFQGSAPSMESEGAKRVFQRSIEKNGLRYTEFFGDGDSKGFPTIEKIYDDVTVVKRECIGHVQKRVGTRLRRLKKSVKGLGGKGKLTDSMIDKLQNYYGIALRSNVGNLENMKKAILASLFHVASSESNSWHNHCPQGKDSWCAFQADKANGLKTYKPGKGLPLDVLSKVKPIYKELSDDKLLERCLHGKTQNANESFHGTIWNRLPKQTYVRSIQFQLGVYDAVASFNAGSVAMLKILEKMKIDHGKYTLLGCREINELRRKNAEIKRSESFKHRRRQLRGQKKKKDDKHCEIEGKTYEPGGF